MANVKIVHIAVHNFSSHPGHGSASKTVASYQAAANKDRQVFPAARTPHGK